MHRWSFIKTSKSLNREQEESIRAYETEMKENRTLLRPEHANKSPPFAAAQYTEAAFSRVVRLIWTNASEDTQSWYAIGHGQNGDNWVILWMLYHVCRYRDNRNKAKQATSRNFHDDDDLDDNSGEGTYQSLTYPSRPVHGSG